MPDLILAGPENPLRTIAPVHGASAGMETLFMNRKPCRVITQMPDVLYDPEAKKKRPPG